MEEHQEDQDREMAIITLQHMLRDVESGKYKFLPEDVNKTPEYETYFHYLAVDSLIYAMNYMARDLYFSREFMQGLLFPDSRWKSFKEKKNSESEGGNDTNGDLKEYVEIMEKVNNTHTNDKKEFRRLNQELKKYGDSLPMSAMYNLKWLWVIPVIVVLIVILLG